MSARTIAERFSMDPSTVAGILDLLNRIPEELHESTIQAVDRYITVARKEGTVVATVSAALLDELSD